MHSLTHVPYHLTYGLGTMLFSILFSSVVVLSSSIPRYFHVIITFSIYLNRIADTMLLLLSNTYHTSVHFSIMSHNCPLRFRDTHGLATKKDKILSIFMIVLAMFSKVVAIYSDAYSLIKKNKESPRS